MIANVNAASVITAAETGAVYRYGFIWILTLLVIPLFFIQEASGRIGAVTGKGLGEVIRTNYSRKIRDIRRSSDGTYRCADVRRRVPRALQSADR